MILTKTIFSRFSVAGRLFIWQKGQRPKEIQVNQNVKKTALGPNHSLILGESGKVYSFGNNKNGQLGHGNKINSAIPKQIKYFAENNIKVKDICCGQRHSLVLDEQGHVYSFGYGGKSIGFIMNIFTNPISPLGHNTTGSVLKPTRINALQKQTIQKITCGKHFSTAITNQGKIYNWGNGEYGVFGDGKNKDYLIPNQNRHFVYLRQKNKNQIKKIKSCQSYSIALLNDGKLVGWGSNNAGQMGLKLEIGVEMFQIAKFPTSVIRDGYDEHKVVNFDISKNSMIFQLDNNELWWTGMKFAYKPEKFKLNITNPHLFAAGNNNFAVIDKENNIYTGRNYVKGDFEEHQRTGILKSNGQSLFGGQILGIGGQYNNRYAIVK